MKKKVGRPKGINTFTIAFEADKRIKEWYDSLPIRGIKLIHEDLGFEVAICCHKSQIKNHELALTFFKLFIDEVINP